MVQVLDVTSIECNDQKPFVDEERIFMEEKKIDLATGHQNTINKKLVK